MLNLRKCHALVGGQLTKLPSFNHTEKCLGNTRSPLLSSSKERRKFRVIVGSLVPLAKVEKHEK